MVYGIIGLCLVGVAFTAGMVIVRGKDGGRDPTMWAWIDVVSLF